MISKPNKVRWVIFKFWNKWLSIIELIFRNEVHILLVAIAIMVPMTIMIHLAVGAPFPPPEIRVYNSEIILEDTS